MKDLPLDRERALTAIAAGWGRTATAAHPMCMCSEQRRLATRPEQPVDVDDEAGWADYAAAYNAWRNELCPMHQPEPRRRTT